MANADDLTIEQMEALYAENEEIHYQISRSNPLHIKMKQKGLPFYFPSTEAAISFRQLEEYVQLGCTDVYIADDLCYNLEKVRKFCDINNLQIRLVLNRIASFRNDKGVDPRAPWFAPEAVDELSKYIDIGEFDCDSWLQINTYYRIWFERQEWRENLKHIYLDMGMDIPNQSLMPAFESFKMNCGYRCAYGSPCKKCNQFIEIAQDLFSKHIEYIERG